jgi:zinc/manganese transport system substrate-binding protein
MFFQHRSSFLVASLLALGLGSCGFTATSPNESPETNNETAEATSQEKLQIVTTLRSAIKMKLLDYYLIV